MNRLWVRLSIAFSSVVLIAGHSCYSDQRLGELA